VEEKKVSENSSKWKYTLCGAVPLMVASVFHYAAQPAPPGSIEPVLLTAFGFAAGGSIGLGCWHLRKRSPKP
jgi:hypothetical protein